MCGITGIFSYTGEAVSFDNKVRLSLDSLKHRGPDNSGIKIFDYAILGHTRLSIIDLSDKAAQPMCYDRFCIVFNGEIYNYRELKRDLLQKGIVFNTESDTEVLLALYKVYGKDMLPLLNGDFAFAIYDVGKKELFIARDRFGIKPLYFINGNGFFAFASELNALEYYFDKLPGIDPVSMRIFFEYTYIPAPFTIYNNVRKLAAGSYIVVSQDKTLISSYYDIDRLFYLSAQQEERNIEKKLSEELDSAVRRRLVADVEVGAFLSGGVDSSIVAALAKKHLNKLHTFNIGFPDYPYYDETVYAKNVAKHIGSEHTVFEITDKKFNDTIFEFLDLMSEPFADSSALAFYILSKRTAKDIKVVLSGDGADELFGGYNKHRAFFMAEKPGKLKNLFIRFIFNLLPEGNRHSFLGDYMRKLKKFSQLVSLDTVDKYIYLACFNCKYVQSSDFVVPVNERAYKLRIREMTLPVKTFGGLKGFLLNDVYLVLQNDMLYKADYHSMLNALEVRVPFLDHNVVETAFSISDDMKVNSVEGKIILKNTFGYLLPSEVFERKKHGFEVPVTSYLQNNFAEFSNLFDEKFIYEQGIFSFDFVKKLERMLKSNSHSLYASMIWSYIVFQTWWSKKL